MTTIYSALRMRPTDYVFGRKQDQRLIYDATVEYLQSRMVNFQRASAVLVSGTTEMAQERYMMPGTGMLPPRADGTRAPALRPYGSWDVAYPLHDYGGQLTGTDVERAYMTFEEYQRHVDTVVIGYAERARHEMLRCLFRNTADTFEDPRHGTLTIRPLANGDSVVYPPVIGSATPATENHYLVSGYAASAISDANNPCVTIRDELEEHFGSFAGGSSVALFINNAQRPVFEALTDFRPVPDRFVQPGVASDVPVNLPEVPGAVIGRCNGVWVIEWRYIPANYLLGVHLEVEAPLKERVDPAETGLPAGLTLVSVDEQYPLEGAEWRVRFGFGVANRLNGVVMQLTTNATYAIPTAFA